MKEDRIELLEFYLSKVQAAEDLDLDQLAKITAGMVGADFENIVNLAAHHAARENKEWVDEDCLIYAIKRRKLGVEQATRFKDMLARDVTVSAWHEAGKAVVNYILKSKESLIATTIIPRNGKYGTSQYKQLDYSDNVTKTDMLSRITYLLGGKIAEEMATEEIFGESNTTEKHQEEFGNAQNLARQMVEKFGMGEGEAHLMFHVHEKSSNYLKNIVEKEIHRILEESTKNCSQILKNNVKQLRLLASALIEYETLSGEEVLHILKMGDSSGIKEAREQRKQELAKRAEERRKYQLVDLDRPHEDN